MFVSGMDRHLLVGEVADPLLVWYLDDDDAVLHAQIARVAELSRRSVLTVALDEKLPLSSS